MVSRFAVIGNPIQHSLSPIIHQYFAQQTHLAINYERMLGEKLLFAKQIRAFFLSGGKGINVTLPFKQDAFHLAESHSTRCQLAGAANTLLLKEDKLHADNTDGIGLIRDLKRVIELANKNILILGAGGAARGIIKPLLEMQISSLTIANRTLAKAEVLQGDFPVIKIADLDNLQGEFDVVINATSASLTGDELILPADIMTLKPLCYDLAYRQSQATPFVHYARQSGCIAMDGLGMLVEQAAEAFYVWNGVRPSTEPVLQYLQTMNGKMP